ncbi:DUF4926 domain-containing protein [Planktothrix sp. FACHB-1355]|uniref:DUF4926 domain-containing protein n=1 Tax=Aerosakkonema funiforme FACHB-1375 TaxID=2949571 RepID=A0A926ZFV5_9CYAN|nr:MULTISPECIES: DUF4926 domain-containing protein [Oscillatoriales]MBD2181538.1 DUF4926 domain-containing protein [Aerosakkonema funiforme FACHB-1375]MBD3558965.1 DUF4926 domain-containing protein [Planktothrix sp. FACHB-1355]
MKFNLFTEVVLREDIPKYGLKKGDLATIVEHYLMPESEEDGYSLEGFNVETITVEVAESQIEPVKASVSLAN